MVVQSDLTVRATRWDEDVIGLLIDTSCVYTLVGWLPAASIACSSAAGKRRGPAIWQLGGGEAGKRAPLTEGAGEGASYTEVPPPAGPQGHEERGPADRPSNVH